MTLLHLKTINKNYNDGAANEVLAVKDFDLEVQNGEIVALLGSSGCGKTSTLRMIAGFESVTSGEIIIGDDQIQNIASARRGVAMAFEGYALYPPLTVRENISFALKSEKLPSSEIDSQVNHIAKLLEIDDILDKFPNSISSGQQQRVSLGRSLIRRAKLHLLDEPMGQLEPQLRAILRGRIKHYIKENNLTVILVTHDQTEANALADRIAVMENGILQQYGTPDDLKNYPANMFTGSFIGEPPMNLFHSIVQLTEQSIDLKLSNEITLSYPKKLFSEELSTRIHSEEKIILGIRPHSVQISNQGTAAEVFACQWLGDQTHIAAKFADSTIVSVLHDRKYFNPGDQIFISIDASDLHLFDHKSGIAISHGGKIA